MGPHRVTSQGSHPRPAALPFAAAIAADDAATIAVDLKAVASPARRRALLEERDEHGSTAILRAIHARKLNAAAMLAYHGADLATGSKIGANALFAGLTVSDPRFTKVILERPDLLSRAHDGTWFSTSELCKALASLDSTSTSADIDAVTAAITWHDVAGLRDGKQLQKYMAHTQAMVRNPFGVDPEVWTTYNFLLSRTRTLIALIAKGEAPGRESLLRELACTLETLRLERRVWLVWENCNEGAARPLFEHEAESIVRRLESRGAGDPYVIPSGWSGNPSGHAFYTSLENIERDGKPMTRVWIDNLGDGRSNHPTIDSRVYPLAIDVPRTADGRALLKTFVAGCLFNRGSNGSEHGFYDRYSILCAKLIAAHGPAVVVDTTKVAKAHSRQTASNCTFANSVPGLSRRLGDKAAASMLAAEREIARQAVVDLLVPAALDSAIAENEDRVRKTLASDIATPGSG